VKCYFELGLLDQARRLALEVLAGVYEHPDEASIVGEFAFAARELGVEREVRDAIELARPSRWRDLALAGVQGDVERELELLEEIGFDTDAAECRLALAKSLIESGRRADGEAELQKALEFYRQVGASFFMHRGEALLPRSA
jgi:hypothetical protein